MINVNKKFKEAYSNPQVLHHRRKNKQRKHSTSAKHARSLAFFYY